MTRTLAGLPGFSYKEVIADGADGESLIVNPLHGKPLTCTLIAGDSTGKIQFTTSPIEDVRDETCVWQDWPGASTGTVSDVLLGAVTAVRGVSISGEISVELVY
jgi:hypothetical protein